MHDPTEVLPRRRAQESTADPMLGRVVDGRYRLRKVLGRGAMGAVYAARHEITDRDVAVKLIPSPLDARAHERRQRFFREVRAPARIHHPAMVEVIDAGESEGMLYLVMEMLEGEDLSEVLQRGPVQWKQLRGWIDEVLDALQAAHTAGFVHRDIKPANIFVCRDGSIKLLDFGVVKQDGASLTALTADGMIIGTPWYMSPEQAAAEESGPAADIWAVGAVIFHALSGEPPVSESKPIDTISAIVRGNVRRLSEMDVDAPVDVCAVTDRAMAHRVSDRFESALAMKSALRTNQLGVATVGEDAGGWDSSTAAMTNVAIDTANIPTPPAARARWPALLLGLLLGGVLAGSLVLVLDDNPTTRETITIESHPKVVDLPPPKALLVAKPKVVDEEPTVADAPAMQDPPADRLAIPADASPSPPSTDAPEIQAPEATAAPPQEQSPKKTRRRLRRSNKRKTTKARLPKEKKIRIMRDYE